jgi:hypothetical protein
MKNASDELVKISDHSETIKVGISNEVVTLLSQQLYQSPLKAIEELVVNSYDAAAKSCKLFVPDANSLLHNPESLIAIYDDGTGMTDSGMKNLWHVGRSDKRTEEIQKRAKRKQIGKFGIGKLAVFVISHQLSYISKTKDTIWFSSLDFTKFHSDEDGGTVPVEIDIRTIKDIAELKKLSWMDRVVRGAGITKEDLNSKTWTLAVLEDFKEKAGGIKQGSLNWVLRTAMPLKSDFNLYLNSNVIKSSKEDVPVVVAFKLSDIKKDRISALSKATGESWEVHGDLIQSKSFPSGIKGEVIVTERTLPGKSDDILRSNGFFIRVRGRLIAQEEPFFGMSPLYHGVMNRLRADIDADDLDDIIKAPREEVEVSDKKRHFESFLREVFQETRQRWEDYLKEKESEEERKKESKRSFISSEIVERPIAGAIARSGSTSGGDADNTWFYLQPGDTNWKSLVESLYASPRKKFTFEYSHLGKSERIIKFRPSDASFTLNLDHEFIASYSGDELSKYLLHDFVIAEVLLEAQLRLVNIMPSVIGEVLEERDALLRSLAKDHPLSSTAIAQHLRDSTSNQYDLEVALVAAARALGFVAKHISGAGEPDVVARFVEYPRKDTLIIIEAKSSAGVPTLPQLDFAGIKSHMENTAYNADGCLLVAPKYPGETRGTESEVSLRSKEQKVSCWTIEQLAEVIESIEQRRISARQVLDIVVSKYSPDDVSMAVKELLSSPIWDHKELKSGLLTALSAIEERMLDRPRSIDMVATKLSDDTRFSGITVGDVRKALVDLAAVSQGGLIVDGDTVVLLASVNEVRRRSQPHISGTPQPRRISTLRGDLPAEQNDKHGH